MIRYGKSLWTEVLCNCSVPKMSTFLKSIEQEKGFLVRSKQSEVLVTDEVTLIEEECDPLVLVTDKLL